MPSREYPKGSEWRRWDLQVQTIIDDGYTSVADHAEELKASQPEKWQEYVDSVGGEINALRFDSKEYFADGSIDKAERCRNYARNLLAFVEVFNPDLGCIGVTDHNYFDDQLLDVLVAYSRKAKCKVIPGVEINCNGIHMLLFFSRPPCNQDGFSEGITTLLKRLDITTRKSGGGVLTVTTNDPKKIIDEVNDEDALVIFPHCNSDNGLFQERGKTDRSVLADLFNHQQMNLLQAQNRQSTIAVAEYIEKNEHLAAAFSCHISSDSRALRDIGRPDAEGHFLWIKAEPSYQGLKQIVYEPDRIFIGTEQPEQKKPYLVIDQARFLDNTKNIRFSSDSIDLNQNLTTIIGGKSTGKSLLLYYIAKTIDPSEVEQRTSIGDLASYDLDRDPDFNFEVMWKDGHKNLLRPPEVPSEAETERKILYIPQKYLNTLSETNFQSREALNRFVLDVMLQDVDVREQYEATGREIKNASRDIPSQVAELFHEKDYIKRAEEELKQLGDEKGIRNYIKPLQQQVDDIKAKSGFDKTESEKYEAATAREKDILAELSNLGEDKKTLRNFDSVLAGHVAELAGAVEEYEEFLHDGDVKKAFGNELKVVDSIASTLLNSTTAVGKVIDAKILRLNEEVAKIKADLAPLLAKVKLQSELKAKTEAIKAEEQKLNDIAIRNAALKTKKASYDRKAAAVVETYKAIMGRYDQMRNEFKKFESRFGDIALRVLVGFKGESFNAEVVREYLNRRELKRLVTEENWGDDYNYLYEATRHIPNIATVFNGLLEGTIGTVKNRPPRDAATKLLDDYFYLDFQIF